MAFSEISNSAIFGAKYPITANYGQITHKIVICGFGGPSGTRGAIFNKILWGPTGPPICEIQCSTLFNRCSTQIGQLGLPRAKYFQTWQDPKGPFSMGPKGSNWSLHMWDTIFNPVQPVSNPNRPARTAYGQVLPSMAKNGGFWP